jgi:hypothetical protein
MTKKDYIKIILCVLLSVIIYLLIVKYKDNILLFFKKDVNNQTIDLELSDTTGKLIDNAINNK